MEAPGWRLLVNKLTTRSDLIGSGSIQMDSARLTRPSPRLTVFLWHFPHTLPACVGRDRAEVRAPREATSPAGR